MTSTIAAVIDIDSQATIIIKRFIDRKTVDNYWLSGKDAARFVVVVDKCDIDAKMSPVQPEVLAQRLLRAKNAALIIQRFWRLTRTRMRRKKQRMANMLIKQLLLQSVRNKVELSIAKRHDKFIKLRSYFLKKQENEKKLDRIEMASRIVGNILQKGFIRRAGFAMFMIKDYRDPLFPSMLQSSNRLEESSRFHQRIKKKKRYLTPKYVDTFHALIFKNFKLLGRREGHESMADSYRRFMVRAKAFYTIIRLHNESLV